MDKNRAGIFPAQLARSLAGFRRHQILPTNCANYTNFLLLPRYRRGKNCLLPGLFRIAPKACLWYKHMGKYARVANGGREAARLQSAPADSSH